MNAEYCRSVCSDDVPCNLATTAIGTPPSRVPGSGSGGAQGGSKRARRPPRFLRRPGDGCGEGYDKHAELVAAGMRRRPDGPAIVIVENDVVGRVGAIPDLERGPRTSGDAG